MVDIILEDTEPPVFEISMFEDEPSHTQTIRNVCHYIHNHLDQDLNLEELAKYAGISPFHFHRIFNRLVGETVKAHIRRLRLEKAAYKLKTREESILDIALEAGYETHETFTRAFRKSFKLNPSAYRKRYQLRDTPDDFPEELKRLMDPNQIRVERVPDLTMAFMRMSGPYTLCPEPLQPNSPWRVLQKALHLRGLYQPSPTFLGICLDDPEITPEHKIRFDACITVPRDCSLKEDSFLRLGRYDGGWFIVVPHTGPFLELTPTYEYMLYHWLPKSDYRMINRPPMEIYLDPFADTDESPIIELYFPIEKPE